jgi:hypothetical protein
MAKLNENFDVYELLYRDYKNYSHEHGIDVSESTIKIINDILEDIRFYEPKDMDEIKFSDVSYHLTAAFNKEMNTLEYIYIPILKTKNNSIDVTRLVKRFRELDINKLPLIEVVKFLNIKIEKSNILEVFGRYNHVEHKITLGSDYVPTFIHELVHAIDHILPNRNDKLYYAENVAELSTILLCRIYNIPINISYSLYYLQIYNSSKINNDEVYKRVLLICEYIKICEENSILTSTIKENL